MLIRLLGCCWRRCADSVDGEKIRLRNPRHDNMHVIITMKLDLRSDSSRAEYAYRRLGIHSQVGQRVPPCRTPMLLNNGPPYCAQAPSRQCSPGMQLYRIWLCSRRKVNKGRRSDRYRGEIKFGDDQPAGAVERNMIML